MRNCSDIYNEMSLNKGKHIWFLKVSLFHHFPVITGDQITLLISLHHHTPFWGLKSDLSVIAWRLMYKPLFSKICFCLFVFLCIYALNSLAYCYMFEYVKNILTTTKLYCIILLPNIIIHRLSWTFFLHSFLSFSLHMRKFPGSWWFSLVLCEILLSPAFLFYFVVLWS